MSPGTPRLRSLLWRVVGAPALALSYHNMYGFRHWWLRLFGAELGAGCRVRRSARIDAPWAMEAGERSIIGDRAVLRGPGRITIGDRTTISQLVTISTVRALPGGGEAGGAIAIGIDCWVAADTLVLPGAEIGEGTLVGARAVVEGALPPWVIATGEPATPRKPRYLKGRHDPPAEADASSAGS